jgi:precorrin-6Y C5,15-methyltransferase (decarboxylating)
MTDAQHQHQPDRWLAIVGLGEDGVEGLSPAAKALIANAKLVIGGRRHLALADGLPRGDCVPWLSPIAESLPTILAYRGEPVTVLASGDPYCFGVGAMLSAHVPPEETICVPAASSLSLACARLGWALDDLATISLCGRPIHTLAPVLQPKRRVLALSADATTPADMARYLAARGFESSVLHVLEALGGPRERIRTTSADRFGFNDVEALNLVGIEVEASPGAKIIPLAAGLPDEMFEHDGQITKREIRAVTLSSLAPRAGELLWDIGCGSGSISIEWLLRHPANRAIAIERETARAARAAANSAELGVPRLEVVTGEVPAVLAALPAPHAVFIGGGGAPQVIDRSWAALNPGGRLVANAITIETERALLAAQARYGGMLTRISIERLDTVGGKHAFRPGMTVSQWSAVKPLVEKPIRGETTCGEAMIVAGLGCRKACDAGEILRLVEQALVKAAQPRSALAALATPAFKAATGGPREAANALGLPLLLINEDALKAAEPRSVTPSAAALKTTGHASVAESAALAAAGEGATLLLPRIKGPSATCALAKRATP